MKITGIIAEFNPFHKGHEYLVQEIAKNSDYTVVIMSGDYVQRGAPAIFNKYTRTAMALSCGVDAVFELPLRYACASAPYFAGASIAALVNMACVDQLYFGSEAGSISLLKEINQLMSHPTPEYNHLLKEALSKGKSYPAARASALRSCSFEENTSLAGQKEQILALISEPNNILALEYLHYMDVYPSSMNAVTLKRKGAGYHELQREEDKLPSASMIRHAISLGDYESASIAIPPKAQSIFRQALEQKQNLTTFDLSYQLRYRLLNTCSDELSSYLDVNEDLAHRIMASLPQLYDWDSFCEKIKSRNLTYTRVSRSLLHILLNIKNYHLSKAPEEVVPYLRLLGFKKKSSPLLSEIKKNCQVPIISKLADRHRQLNTNALQMINQDIWASDFYESIISMRNRTPFIQENSQRIVIR